MGGGNPIKKVAKTVKKAASQVGSEAKRAVKNVPQEVIDVHKKVGHKVIDLNVGALKMADKRTGGVGGGLLETVTGGAIQSIGTKKALKEASDAQAKADKEQQDILDKQKQALDKEDAERKERMRRSKQGRRSLLYTGTDETGLGG